MKPFPSVDQRTRSVSSKLRVLISAYGCGPGRGSEPGVGWNWAVQMAHFHEVWVLTPERERAAIEAYRGNDLPPGLHFVVCDLPPAIRPCGTRTLIEYMLHYHLWQVRAYFIGRKLHKQQAFDIVHHLTLGAHWMPSLLCLLPVPFIWGPVGGGEILPDSFWSFLSWKARAFETCRVAARKLGELSPLVRLTARRAALALSKTEDTAGRVRAMGCKNVRVFSEAGLPDSELRTLNSLPLVENSPIRFLSMGRLNHWKGFELGLRAFIRIHRDIPDATFCMVGDGVARERLEQIAAEAGISDKVEFCGWLSREKALEKLAQCSVLVHPSLHDSGGWVCLEAMAAGRPVICLDLGGPAVQVTGEVGFKISPDSPDKCIESIAQVMRLLESDRGLLTRIGATARRFVNENYSWPKKAFAIADIYDAYTTKASTQLDRVHAGN